VFRGAGRGGHRRVFRPHLPGVPRPARYAADPADRVLLPADGAGSLCAAAPVRRPLPRPGRRPRGGGADRPGLRWAARGGRVAPTVPGARAGRVRGGRVAGVRPDRAGRRTARPGARRSAARPAGRRPYGADGRQRRGQDHVARSLVPAAALRRRDPYRRPAAGGLGRGGIARPRGPDRAAALPVRRQHCRQHPPGAPRCHRWTSARGRPPRPCAGLHAGHAGRTADAVGRGRPRPVRRADAAGRPGAAVPARPGADPAGRAHGPPGRCHPGAGAGRNPVLCPRPHLAAGNPCTRRGGAPAARRAPGARHAGARMRSLRLLLPLYRRRWRGLLAALALALLTIAAGVGLLGVSGWFLSAAALAGAGTAFNLFVPSALVRLLSFLRIASRYAERLVGHAATLRLLTDLRTRVFDALVRLTPRQLARYRGGDLVARLTGDVDALDTVFLHVLAPVATAAAAGALLAGVLGYRLPVAGAILALAMGIVTLAIPAWLALAARRPGRAAQESLAALRAATLEAVQGHADLVVLHAAGQARARFAGQCAAAARARDAQARTAAAGLWLLQVAAGGCVVAVLWFGLDALARGELGGPLLAG